MTKGKKIAAAILFAAIVIGARAETPRRAAVAVLPFEADDTLRPDADALWARVVSELESWEAYTILTGREGSEYLVRTRLEEADEKFVLSATVIESRTNRLLNTAREEEIAMDSLYARVFSFAARVTESISFPNYLVGLWRAEALVPDGPLTCLVEFRSDRSVRFGRFDTWEKHGNTTLRYEGYGSGMYSFWGHVRRTVRGLAVDGFVTVNLRLEDSLPRYASRTYTRMNFNYNDDKTTLTLVGGGFLCGEDFSGSGGQTCSYVTFTKLR